MMHIKPISKALSGARMFLLALSLTACSSGQAPTPTQSQGPATPPSDPPPEAPPEPTYSGGYLYGELTLDGALDATYPIQVMLSEDGRFRALQIGPYSYPRTYLLLRGSFRLDGRQISGEGIAIADPGETWSDGETVTAITLSGTLDRPTTTTDGKLLVSLSMGSGDSGGIDTKYAQLSGYWNGSDLGRLAGNWSAEINEHGSWHPDPYRNADPPLPEPGYLEFAIASNGEFTGTDDDGCETAGHFGLIDTRYSLWSVDYTISNCDRAGTYSGFALGDNRWYATRSLSFSADDGTRSQSLDLWQLEH
jgi:hypothetical protein